MVFVYDGPTNSATDIENNIRISSISEKRDGPMIFGYLYTQGEVQFRIDVIYRDTDINYINQVTGVEETAPVTFEASIIQDRFDEELSNAFIRANRMEPQLPEYRLFVKAAEEGIYCIMSKGGEMLKFKPDMYVQYIPTFSSTRNTFN